MATDHETGTANVTFYAADLQTKYRVVVEGVTSKGEPIHAEAYVTIEK